MPGGGPSGEQGGVHKIDKETCVDCGACDTVCPVEVIKGETTAWLNLCHWR